MSATEPHADLRPARVTPVLGLPIPGDAGPADYVTDTGRIADRIDRTLGEIHIWKDTVGYDFPPDPELGQRVVFHLTGKSYTADEYAANVTNPHWEFVAGTDAWLFVGGPPLRVTELTREGLIGSNGTFQLVGPWLRDPFGAGMFATGHFGMRAVALNDQHLFALLQSSGAVGWPMGVWPGSIEFGSSNNGIHYATLTGEMYFRFPQTPNPLWTGVLAGAPNGASYGVSRVWMSVTPAYVPFPGAGQTRPAVDLSDPPVVESEPPSEADGVEWPPSSHDPLQPPRPPSPKPPEPEQ